MKGATQQVEVVADLLTNSIIRPADTALSGNASRYIQVEKKKW